MDDQYSPERNGQLVGFLNDKEVRHGDRLYFKDDEKPVPCIAYLSYNYTRPFNKKQITVRVIDWGEYSKEDCHSFEVNYLYRSTNIQDDPEYANLFI